MCAIAIGPSLSATVFTVDDAGNLYDGSYSVDPALLAAGPALLMPPRLAVTTSAEVGGTLAVTPALFAYDPDLGPLEVSYSPGVDATNPDAPVYVIRAEDAGTTVTVTATATQGSAQAAGTSAGLAIADVPVEPEPEPEPEPAPPAEPFRVTLAADGTLCIEGNDGRVFSVDDAGDLYDGSYSVDPALLAAGPVLLMPPRLTVTTSAEVGETLTVRPALFAYDPDLGPLEVSYSPGVDAANPDAPTYLVRAEDAGTTVTVTATATQGSAQAAGTSAGLAIADVPVEPEPEPEPEPAPPAEPFRVTLAADGTLCIEGNDGRVFSVDDAGDLYDGSYSVDPALLAAGPALLMPPRLAVTTSAEVGGTLAVTPALFAYDPDLGPLEVSYSPGVDATNPDAPVYVIRAEDAGTTITVTATATQGSAQAAGTSAGLAIADVPVEPEPEPEPEPAPPAEPFRVTLAADGTLCIEGNDGRVFSVDDAGDLYDGSYSVDPALLAAGPVLLMPPRLTVTTSAEVGETLTVRPALFAYDPDLGPLEVSYSPGVDAANPDAPTYLVRAEDAGTTITVTATAVQGSAQAAGTSAGLAIADVPVEPEPEPAPPAEPFRVTLAADGTLCIEGNDGRVFSVDDAGDLYDGSYSVDPALLAAGPVLLMPPRLAVTTSAEVGGTLAVTPALFAYDPDLGPLEVSYSPGVDAANPDAPTYLVRAEDAGTTITVTATAVQGSAQAAGTSAGLAIADVPVEPEPEPAPPAEPFRVTLAADGTLCIEGNDGRVFSVDDAGDLYDGSYSVDPALLAAGPALLMPPRLAVTTSAEVGGTLAVTPALFAYDPDLGPLEVSYSPGVDATNPDAPTYLVRAEDAGTTVTVTATATQGSAQAAGTSAGLAIADVPVEPEPEPEPEPAPPAEPFRVTLAADGTLCIEGNDGRVFSVDDAGDLYDGSYSVDPALLAAGPVLLMPPRLTVTTSAEVGETLTVRPALFAYDPDLGPLEVSYSPGVDAANPDAPTYLVRAEDAGTTITVTATAVQGSAQAAGTSAGLAIADVPVEPEPEPAPPAEPFRVTLAADGTLCIEGNDGRVFSVDDAGDLYDGSYSVDPALLAAGPVLLMPPRLTVITSAEVGETLTVRPALFAYDPDLGPLEVSYSPGVDAANPDAPTYLVRAEDAGTTITVTATAVQGSAQAAGTSAGLAIADVPVEPEPEPEPEPAPPAEPFRVTLAADGTLCIEGNDGRVFSVDDAGDLYDGSYSVDPALLAAGPVLLMPPRLTVTTSAEVGETLTVRPALFAYDPDLGPLEVSYSPGVDAANPDAPTYLVRAEDAGTTITVTATAVQGSAQAAGTSAGLAIADVPVEPEPEPAPPAEPFRVTLAADGTLCIEGNDGRVFSVDDAGDLYDGSYSVDPALLAAGPVLLMPPRLTVITSAEVGETLTVRPALFAYDPDLGPLEVSYSPGVDAANPDAPTYLVRAEDAGTTITVTATAVQGSAQAAGTSAGLAIADVPVEPEPEPAPPAEPFRVTLAADGTLCIEGNDGRVFSVDDAGDLYDGSYSVDPALLAAGPVLLMPPRLTVTTSAEVGETLTVRPALFAYDPDLGPLEVSYSPGVDAANPDAPVYVIRPEDAGTTVTVTTTATQGTAQVAAASAGVGVP